MYFIFNNNKSINNGVCVFSCFRFALICCLFVCSFFFCCFGFFFWFLFLFLICILFCCGFFFLYPFDLHDIDFFFFPFQKAQFEIARDMDIVFLFSRCLRLVALMLCFCVLLKGLFVNPFRFSPFFSEFFFGRSFFGIINMEKKECQMFIQTDSLLTD